METFNAKPEEGLENRVSGRDGLGVSHVVLPPAPSRLAGGAGHTGGTRLGPCRLRRASGGSSGADKGDPILREQLSCSHRLRGSTCSTSVSPWHRGSVEQHPRTAARPGQHRGRGSHCRFDPLPIPDPFVDGCRGLLLRVLSLWCLQQNFCEQMEHCELYINAALHLFAVYCSLPWSTEERVQERD